MGYCYMAFPFKKKKDFKMYIFTRFVHIMIKTGYRHSALVSMMYYFVFEFIGVEASMITEKNVGSETSPDLKL